MRLASGDLPSTLIILAIFLAIVALGTLISIGRARRRGGTNLALDVTRTATYGWVALMIVLAALAVPFFVFQRSVTLTDPILSYVEDAESQLASPRCPGGGTAEVSCGPFVDDVPLQIRLLILVGTLMLIATSAAIGWAVHTATRRAGQRDPFHPSVAQTFRISAIVVLVGAVVGQLLVDAGMTLTAQTLAWPDDMRLPYFLDIPLWPFAVAVGLFALSAIFGYGAQLQREKEQLQRETEGLV